MASDTTTAAEAPEEAEAVEEYDSDPDEVKHSLVMRRMEASDDEEEVEKEFERRIVGDESDESDAQNGSKR